MPLQSRVVLPSLSKKGFQVEEGKDQMFRHYLGGRRTGVWTKISHGNHEIHDGLLGAMKKQLKLRSKREVISLCDCTMSSDAYLEILREEGHLPR